MIIQSYTAKIISFEHVYRNYSKLPQASGVYFFYNYDNELLYVGRAKNFRNRINQHCTMNSVKRKYDFNFASLYSEFVPKEAKIVIEKCIKTMNCWSYSQQPLQSIDAVFHTVNVIKFQPMSHEISKIEEKELIAKLKPTYNFESNSTEYYSIYNNSNDYDDF